MQKIICALLISINAIMWGMELDELKPKPTCSPAENSLYNLDENNPENQWISKRLLHEVGAYHPKFRITLKLLDTKDRVTIPVALVRALEKLSLVRTLPLDVYKIIENIIYAGENKLLKKQAESYRLYRTVECRIEPSWVHTSVTLPDGTRANALWSAISLQNPVTDQRSLLEGHKNRIHSLMALPNGLLVSGAHDETIKIWNIKTAECIRTLQANDPVCAVVTLPDGKFASKLYHSPTVSIWKPLMQPIKKTLINYSIALWPPAIINRIEKVWRDHN
jgi:WD40 domain-containing protein